MVLRAGAMVELSAAEEFFAAPRDGYSRRLLETTAAQMLGG
jgi:ABC-type dipeptide/oligopeptide/nickel transport system ATPase component